MEIYGVHTHNRSYLQLHFTAVAVYNTPASSDQLKSDGKYNVVECVVKYL